MGQGSTAGTAQHYFPPPGEEAPLPKRASSGRLGLAAAEGWKRSTAKTLRGIRKGFQRRQGKGALVRQKDDNK